MSHDLAIIYILDIFSWFTDFKLELKAFNVHDKVLAFSKMFQLWICQERENNFGTFRPLDLLWMKMNKMLNSLIEKTTEGNTW